MIREKSPIILACEELGKRIRELKSAIERLNENTQKNIPKRFDKRYPVIDRKFLRNMFFRNSKRRQREIRYKAKDKIR